MNNELIFEEFENLSIEHENLYDFMYTKYKNKYTKYQKIKLINLIDIQLNEFNSEYKSLENNVEFILTYLLAILPMSISLANSNVKELSWSLSFISSLFNFIIIFLIVYSVFIKCREYIIKKHNRKVYKKIIHFKIKKIVINHLLIIENKIVL